MNSNRRNINLIDNYFKLLKNLSAESKLKLIEKLTNSMKPSKQNRSNSLKFLSGDFIPEKTADELINEIRESRTFDRKTEKF